MSISEALLAQACIILIFVAFPLFVIWTCMERKTTKSVKVGAFVALGLSAASAIAAAWTGVTW